MLRRNKTVHDSFLDVSRVTLGKGGPAGGSFIWPSPSPEKEGTRPVWTYLREQLRTLGVPVRCGIAGAHGLACKLVQLDVAIAPRAGLRRVARHEFEVAAIGEQARIGVEPGRRVAAENAPQRLAGALPGQVPKCDLDARESVHERAVAPEQVHAVQRLAREPVDVAGIPADHEGRHDGVERRFGGRDRAWPKASPQPTRPSSVSTRTRRISSPSQGCPAKSGWRPPIEKGKETTELSTASMCMDAHKLVQPAPPAPGGEGRGWNSGESSSRGALSGARRLRPRQRFRLRESLPLLNYHPPQEMDGLYSCLDYFQAVDDPFSRQLQEGYAKKFPGTRYLFTAGSASTGMYRGIKLYEAAVQETGGKLGREDVAAALDHAKIAQGPGGGAEMVPGKMHCRMNMYVAVCKVEAGKPRYDVIRRYDMVDPKEC